jgi:diguanylate cyclase (GGDEF)-like protein
VRTAPELVAVAAAAACAAAAVARRASRPALAGWALLALALLLLAVAGTPFTWTPAPLAAPGGVAVPVSAVLFASIGVLLLHRRPPRWLPERRWDAAIVLLGSAATASALLPGPSGSPGLPPPAWLAAPACLALAAAALAAPRSQPVVWWAAGGLLVVARGLSARPGTILAALLTGAGFALVGAGALTQVLPGLALGTRSPSGFVGPGVLGDRRRAGVPTGFSPRGLSWAGSVAALVVVGAAVAGAPVPRGAAVLGWAALALVLTRSAVAFLSSTGAGDDELTDRLTGLASREAISVALATEALATDGTAAGSPDDGWTGLTDQVALLLADIDGFEQINVALGREAGDAVLTEVGARLQAVLRPPQLLARLGGDEFAVLLPGAGPEPATRVATALREALTLPLDVDGGRLSVQATVGIATCVLPRGRPEDLLRQADAAVHRAKSTGSGIAVYDAERDGAGPLRLRRVDELRSAVERGDLVVHLQPQIELASGRVAGCEALARWRHPNDGVLLPDAFLPLAAHTGLMRPVAAVVLDRALEACALWWPRSRVPVSVNLTADDLLDPGLTDRIAGALERHALPGAALRVELTEDALVSDPTAAAALLQGWRALGVGVALDDFGTGYSSLAYLRELPFDELKLDRVFGADLRRRTTLTIVAHTVAMAHGLGLRVVAEGVEDEATARALADLGCDLGQGHAFGAAMAPAEFLTLLARRA